MNKIGNLFSKWFRHAQRVFHMLVGLAFLFLATAGAFVSLSEWRLYRQSSSVGLVRFCLLATFTVVLIVFCLYSFAKARSVR